MCSHPTCLFCWRQTVRRGGFGNQGLSCLGSGLSCLDPGGVVLDPGGVVWIRVELSQIRVELSWIRVDLSQVRLELFRNGLSYPGSVCELSRVRVELSPGPGGVSRIRVQFFRIQPSRKKPDLFVRPTNFNWDPFTARNSSNTVFLFEVNMIVILILTYNFGQCIYREVRFHIGLNLDIMTFIKLRIRIQP